MVSHGNNLMSNKISKQCSFTIRNRSGELGVRGNGHISFNFEIQRSSVVSKRKGYEREPLLNASSPIEEFSQYFEKSVPNPNPNFSNGLRILPQCILTHLRHYSAPTIGLGLQDALLSVTEYAVTFQGSTARAQSSLL